MADRDHVAIGIEEMLAEAQPLFTTKCCIYKVPHEIRQLNEDAYTPQAVSIGPFHHGNEKLLNMEGHKRVYCQHFIKRFKASLDNLVRCVRELEPRVRSCYSEKLTLGVDELVKVILVDSGFIIELFLRNLGDPGDDAILATPWLSGRICEDLLLLENQLPFFVLEKLYNLAFASFLNGDHYPSSFLQLAFDFYSGLNYSGVLPPAAGSIAHFTDLLRTFYLQPSGRLPSTKDGEVLTLPYSASELNEAGVQFTVNESQNLLDIKFSGRILEIPKIRVEDTTEIYLRNMVALEQFYSAANPHITSYVEFLDCLINTDEDVDVLVKNDIILNFLGDNNSVAKLFNGLAKNIFVQDPNADYLRICKELTAFRKNRWNSTKATLRHDYCNTPWKTVASVAGIVLLTLTLIQTVHSIFSWF